MKGHHAIARHFVLEVYDELCGLLVSGDAGYTFHAAVNWAWPLDGTIYPNVNAARQALLRERPAENAADVDPVAGRSNGKALRPHASR